MFCSLNWHALANTSFVMDTWLYFELCVTVCLNLSKINQYQWEKHKIHPFYLTINADISFFSTLLFGMIDHATIICRFHEDIFIIQSTNYVEFPPGTICKSFLLCTRMAWEYYSPNTTLLLLTNSRSVTVLLLGNIL